MKVREINNNESKRIFQNLRTFPIVFKMLLDFNLLLA